MSERGGRGGREGGEGRVGMGEVTRECDVRVFVTICALVSFPEVLLSCYVGGTCHYCKIIKLACKSH